MSAALLRNTVLYLLILVIVIVTMSAVGIGLEIGAVVE
jgi:hypothetical protein